MYSDLYFKPIVNNFKKKEVQRYLIPQSFRLHLKAEIKFGFSHSPTYSQLQ